MNFELCPSTDPIYGTCLLMVGHQSGHSSGTAFWNDLGQTTTREQIHAREYPADVPTDLVDKAGLAVFAEFPGDTWRLASLREVVGVVLRFQRSTT